MLLPITVVTIQKYLQDGRLSSKWQKQCCATATQTLPLLQRLIKRSHQSSVCFFYIHLIEVKLQTHCWPFDHTLRMMLLRKRPSLQHNAAVLLLRPEKQPTDLRCQINGGHRLRQVNKRKAKGAWMIFCVQVPKHLGHPGIFETLTKWVTGCPDTTTM